MFDVVAKLLCRHWMIWLDEVAQLRLRRGGGVFQAMARCESQGKKFVRPKTLTSFKTNSQDCRQYENGKEYPQFVAPVSLQGFSGAVHRLAFYRQAP
jgi:hypothetical protein